DVLDRLTDRKPSRRQRSQKPKSSDSQTSSHPRIKATFHLTVDDILVIDRLQSLEFSQTGKKPERSHIVGRALQLLAKQHKVSGRDGL
ncbi:MAG: hypothetical protein K8I02_13160, partial [Candidatus Methylomirabilis sp.]|nr:hypothetical protein [Deltaproteobacteria bacterium]